MSKSFIGIATGIFIGIIPFVTSRHLFYGAVNSKYFYIIGFISCVGLYFSYLLATNKNTPKVKSRWLPTFLMSAVAIYYLAALTGAYPERSLWSDIIRSSGVFFLTYIAFFAFFLSELLSQRDWSFIRKSIAISSGIFALLTFFGPEALATSGRFLSINFDISGLTLGNSTFAGAYLVIASILTLVEISRVEKGSFWKKILIWILIVQAFSPMLFNWRGSIFDPVSLLGSARSSSATVFLVVIYLFFRFVIKRLKGEVLKNKLLSIWNYFCGIIVLSSVILLFIPNTFIQNEYIKSSTAARIIVWDVGFESIKNRPILGWGPENFDRAFQANFDNRLFLNENIGEVWFDRAHNIAVDTLVDVGVVGLISGIFLVVYFILVVYRAKKAKIIEEAEAVLLSILPIAHILQLWTSFDTVATYTLSGIVLGYGLWLEKEILKSKNQLEEAKIRVSNIQLRRVMGIALSIMVIVGFKYLFIDEYGRQKALFKMFETIDSKKQIEYINKATGRESSFESLRLSSASFMNSSLFQISKEGNSKSLLDTIRNQMSVYDGIYNSYVNKLGDDYRARMNYTYLLILRTAFGDDKIKEAQLMVRDSYDLSPTNPITYALDSLTELYSGNIKKSKEIMTKGIELNKDINFSKDIYSYIEKQEKQFPNITVIKLENL